MANFQVRHRKNGTILPYPVEYKVRLSIEVASLIDAQLRGTKLDMATVLRGIIETAVAGEPRLSEDEQRAFWLQYKIDK